MKTKFLVLPNGTMVEKSSIVSVESQDYSVLLNVPPNVAIRFLVGHECGYASQHCKSVEERDDLIARIRKELGQ